MNTQITCQRTSPWMGCSLRPSMQRGLVVVEWCECNYWPEMQRRHRKRSPAHSAPALNEEVLNCPVVWLNLPEKNREAHTKICGGVEELLESKTNTMTTPADAKIRLWTILLFWALPNIYLFMCLKCLWSQMQRNEHRNLLPPLCHTSHSFALICLLNWAKPATGRKRLQWNVCLGCVCGVSRGGWLGGWQHHVFAQCSAFGFQGHFVHIPHDMTVKGTFSTKLQPPTQLLCITPSHSLPVACFSVPPLVSGHHNIVNSLEFLCLPFASNATPSLQYSLFNNSQVSVNL